jgi:predicted acyl esterase
LLPFGDAETDKSIVRHRHASALLRGDGTLGADGPGGPPRGYRYDPRRPIPISGGRNMLIDAGSRDQRPIQSLADYGLIYCGESLPEDLTIAGEVRVTLSVCGSRNMSSISACARVKMWVTCATE